MTNLKFNSGVSPTGQPYTNFSGLMNTGVTITSDPIDATEALGANVTTMSFNVRLEKNEQFTFVDQATGEQVEGTIEAGEFSVTARGNQFDPTVHVKGGKCLLNINVRAEDNAVLLTASKLVNTINRPIVTFTRKAVEPVVEVAAELATA